MSEIHVSMEIVESVSVARVIIDRENKLNALSSELTTSLREAFLALADDESLGAVVLDGAGDTAWVGGADIAEMANLSADTAGAFISNLHTAMRAVRDLPVPVIARLDGYALGAGMELAAACDIRVASMAAHFGMPEVHVGLPSVIEASLLPRLMGLGRASRLMLTGEVIDAERAYEWGFVEEVVAPELLDDAINAVLSNICRSGPRAVRSQKKLMRSWEGLTPDAAAEASIAVFASAFEAAEPTERLQAFVNRKRS